MRLTVGPLPAAVYWRRRAVVLGALLLFLVIVIYSCSGSGNTGEPTGASGSPGPAGTSPSPTVLTPETGTPSPSEEPPAANDDPGSGGDQGAQPGGNQGGAPAPVGGGGAPSDICTDAEISVVPVSSQESPVVGATIELRLRIKNVSSRTCKRDVGPDPQEIYIKQGARVVWSSDACGTLRGSNVESFTPSFEREYRVSWNGREATRCVDGQAAGDYPQPGEYQLFARVGSKVSEPVKLVIRA